MAEPVAQVVEADVVEASVADDNSGAGAVYNVGAIEAANAHDR